MYTRARLEMHGRQLDWNCKLPTPASLSQNLFLVHINWYILNLWLSCSIICSILGIIILYCKMYCKMYQCIRKHTIALLWSLIIRIWIRQQRLTLWHFFAWNRTQVLILDNNYWIIILLNKNSDNNNVHNAHKCNTSKHNKGRNDQNLLMAANVLV